MKYFLVIEVLLSLAPYRYNVYWYMYALYAFNKHNLIYVRVDTGNDYQHRISVLENKLERIRNLIMPFHQSEQKKHLQEDFESKQPFTNTDQIMDGALRFPDLQLPCSECKSLFSAQHEKLTNYEKVLHSLQEIMGQSNAKTELKIVQDMNLMKDGPNEHDSDQTGGEKQKGNSLEMGTRNFVVI